MHVEDLPFLVELAARLGFTIPEPKVTALRQFVANFADDRGRLLPYSAEPIMSFLVSTVIASTPPAVLALKFMGGEDQVPVIPGPSLERISILWRNGERLAAARELIALHDAPAAIARFAAWLALRFGAADVGALCQGLETLRRELAGGAAEELAAVCRYLSWLQGQGRRPTPDCLVADLEEGEHRIPRGNPGP